MPYVAATRVNSDEKWWEMEASGVPKVLQHDSIFTFRALGEISIYMLPFHDLASIPHADDTSKMTPTSAVGGFGAGNAKGRRSWGDNGGMEA